MANRNYTTINEFRGYRNKRDDTNLEGDGYLVKGSQNVVSNDGGNVEIRQGYTLFGQSNSSLTPIESSYEWKTHRAIELALRSYDDKLQFYYNGEWVDIADGFTAVDFNYAEYWDDTEKQDALLFVNGSSNIYYWSGATATLESSTATTITLAEDTWGESGFLTTGTRTVVINGTEYTYTGGEDTDTLTGVTPDASSAGDAGDLVVQGLRTTANSAITQLPNTFSNDLIAVLDNQVWVGSLTSREVYVSKINDYEDFSFSSPRTVGEGTLLTLDQTPTAFIVEEKFMNISAGQEFWYNSQLSLSDDLQNETLTVERLKTSPQQGAISQSAVGKIKNQIVFISNEPTLDSLGQIKDVNTPQSEPLSDSIKNDFANYDFTGAHVKYFKNNLYITVPKESKMLILNLAKGFWEPPQILPAGRLAIYEGDLYLHSNVKPETYKLFQGHSDLGAVQTVNDVTNISQLEAYWAFDEDTGVYAYDSSKSDNLGDIHGATWVTGKKGSALDFDSIGDYVNVPDSASVQDIFNGGGSLSFWINPRSDGEGNAGRVYVKGCIAYTVQEAAGFVKISFFHLFSGNNGVWTTTDAVVPIGEFSHVVISYDGSSVANVPKIYVNGIEKAVSVSVPPTGTITTDVGTDITIGNNAGLTGTFDGVIDELRLYRKELSDDEVKLLYDSVVDGELLHHYSFDEGTGTTVGDSTLNAADGTAINNPTWTTGISGQCLSLDGVDQYVDLGSDFTSLNGAKSFSISVWVRSNEVPFTGFRGIFAVGGSGQRVPWMYGRDTLSTITFQAETVVGGVLDIGLNSNDLVQGQWTHFVITWDGTNAVMYQDGSVVDTDVSTGSTLADTNGFNYIGFINGFSSWNGEIDELRIYKEALSQNEVDVLYTNPDASELSVKSAIDAQAVFNYSNFGNRATKKDHTEWYSEGYISSNTELELELNYDFAGSESIVTKQIDGDVNNNHIFAVSKDVSLGKQSLGKDKLGGDDESSTKNKFRIIHEMPPLDYFEIQPKYSSNALDQSWEILAYGGDINFSNNENNEIKT